MTCQPKRTECNICYAEKWCMPCGALNNCHVYTCDDCRGEYHRNDWVSGFNGVKDMPYKCPYCNCKDLKMRQQVLVRHAYCGFGGSDQQLEQYMKVIEDGDCCIYPSGVEGWHKYKKEKVRKRFSLMSKEDLIKEIMAWMEVCDEAGVAEEEAKERVMELEQELEKTKRGLARLHADIELV